MGIKRPYRRTCRQFVDGEYAEGGRWMYILHRRYAQSPDHYIRAFLLLQRDLQTIFDYIEPADTNLSCYSFRLHELLLRACIEVEANCRAILGENGYQKSGRLDMNDYCKINDSHYLSDYTVKIPNWHGEHGVRKPYGAWAKEGRLPWYQAYNATKHNRHENFAEANFKNIIDAVCGLLVLLSAQFHTQDFSHASGSLSFEGSSDGMESAIGDYFRITFPKDIPIEDRYDFNWQDLKDLPDPFEKYPYQTLSSD